MRVRLLRSHRTPHAMYAVGTILNYSKGVAEKMIIDGNAEKYTGPYPPKGKMKMNLRDLKIKKQWQ
jgi:hypothetical protein